MTKPSALDAMRLAIADRHTLGDVCTAAQILMTECIAQMCATLHEAHGLADEIIAETKMDLAEHWAALKQAEDLAIAARQAKGETRQ